MAAYFGTLWCIDLLTWRHCGNPLPGLLGPAGIKLNTMAKHFSTIGDNLERHAITNTRVDLGQWSGISKPEESANPLGFRQRQREESDSAFALEAQGWAPFSGRIACVTGFITLPRSLHLGAR
jgi:hypothetical protein